MIKRDQPREAVIFSHTKIAPKIQQLTEIEEKFIDTIWELQYVTVPQLATLHYKLATRSVLNYVASILKTLDEEHDKYLQRGFLGRAVRYGRNPSVFRLATKGIKHIASKGLTPVPAFRPSDPFPSFDMLAHTLEVNNVIIAARRLHHFAPGYDVAEYYHDWVLRHDPIYVENDNDDKTKKPIAVIPDAWIDMRFTLDELSQKAFRFPIHLEVDRGSQTDRKRFEKKICALLRYVDKGYQERFGTPLITIAYAVAGNGNRLLRCKVLRTWYAQLLTKLQRKQDENIFYFTPLPPGDLDTVRFYLQPIWQTPFDDTPKVLLEATTEHV